MMRFGTGYEYEATPAATPSQQEPTMKNAIFSCIFFFLYLGMCKNAFGHQFWVNAYESFTHPPGHALITTGFGHEFPLDDLLTSDYGTIRLEHYQVISPEGKIIDLPKPSFERNMPVPAPGAVSVEEGDLGVRKVQFQEDAAKGSYNVVAVSQPAFVAQYINTAGKKKAVFKPLDQIKDIKDIIFSVKYMSFAKSIFTFGEWTDVEPLGYDLEITPMSDTSKLHAGDILKVRVDFMGKPFVMRGTDIHFVRAVSNTFGGPDQFELMSFLRDGTASFRIPTAGQWLISCYAIRQVDKDPSLADLKGKTESIYYAASLNLTVKP
jgi:uncharacterized GH25 family protein